MTREIPEETRALLKRALRSPASGAAVASAASGSPRAAVKSLRDFDLSPAAVRLQKDLSMVSSSLHEASVKLKDTEVPAIVKTARLAEPEMGKIKDRLLWIKKEVQHEHLVKILGLYWLKPGTLCLAMEPAPRCLRRLIREEPQLVQKQQLPLAHGIASAMAHLHGLLEPLIHQELKPENVLIFESGKSRLLAKVTDVGFNKAIFGHGPLAYKAPELFDGKPCSMASDVYAFAILGWELLCAQEAWAGYTDLCKLKAICVENKRPSMDEKASKSRLGKLIQEAWAQDPAQRPSFEALRDKLSQPSIPKQLAKEVPSYWLRCAWRIEHQSLWDKYVAERNDVIRHLRQLERSSIETPQWRSKLEEATVGMPDELCAPIGERYLLHGTKPEVLLDILHQGFNDKLASLRGMFGAGAYFAEDPEKIDQYTREDPGHEAPGLERLHSRLYRAGGHQHPGDHIFYCFVVRVTCGACFLSHGFKDKLRDHDSDFQVFVNEDRRELSAVPGSDPRIPYHTLVVQTGKEAKHRIERFREVISFSANRAYPEYLLAYQRV
ncbi:putative serine/threonine-protein kinase pats1 [Symbiodinium microadriaticum]|uniref:Putative serine/threonine-protein kinase pats1 n=1 Tax=Symbiodinium microadriaticum TaxID=2951 RepID=A0A1Q9CMV3_SYMMI|nr:putative serine/threonine-protein kinase pats1 [Symbiodinium microadriaticum]